MKCLQCGSEDLVRDVRVVDRGDGNLRQDLKLEVYDNPGALIFKGAHEGKLVAQVCVECGFVMLSVSKKDAEILKKCRR